MRDSKKLMTSFDQLFLYRFLDWGSISYNQIDCQSISSFWKDKVGMAWSFWVLNSRVNSKIELFSGSKNLREENLDQKIELF